MDNIKFNYKKGKLKDIDFLNSEVYYSEKDYQKIIFKERCFYFKNKDCFLEFLCKAANGSQSFKKFRKIYECEDNYKERIDYRECVRAFNQFQTKGLCEEDINNLINEIGL